MDSTNPYSHYNSSFVDLLSSQQDPFRSEGLSQLPVHNMIVEDERDGYTQFNVSEFLQRVDTGSSHVDLDFSQDMPTNIANMMGARTRIRDRQMHQQLKADLVEHIWRNFGRDADNN